MAVAVDPKFNAVGSLAGGRSNVKDVDFATGYVSPIYTNNSSQFSRGLPRTSSLGSQKKLTVLTSAKALGNASSGGASSKQSPGVADANMTSFSSTNATIPATTRSESRLAKLHKRASSGSSLPATPSPLNPSQTQFTTPYPESRASTPTQTSNASFKSRPYIRKLSSTNAREDENQGRLDLSKSVSESHYLPGLGIDNYGSRTASEVTFSHTSRRAAHTRTTSGGSSASVPSRSFTPTQPFVHPMRQTPNGPYTPSGRSYASSVNDGNEDEASDIVTDDPILASQTYRSRRSESISSMPHIQPTPLSQSHSAADFYSFPKHSGSQTNLSTKSGRSGKSSRSKLGRRSRRNTERSSEPGTDVAGRASTDKAFSFVSRRSNTEPEPLSRDERIREKRRQFNEKEASKDRKELKRRETDEAKTERRARKSSPSQHERPHVTEQGGRKISSLRKTATAASEKDTGRVEEFRARSYDDTRPANLTALPKQAIVSEKTGRAGKERERSSGTWPRFSTWMQTRLLSCGGKG